MVAAMSWRSIVKSIKLGLTKVADPSTAGVFPHPDNRHAFVTVQSSPDGVTYSPVQR
jgi:hypothetical protein